MSISAVIITYNDAQRVRKCLEAIRWVDEVLVMDLSSTDSTVAICREFTNRVYTRDWMPYPDPIRDEVCSLASGDWILMLDPDEIVTPELASALRRVAATGIADVVLVPYLFMAFGYERVDPLAITDAIPRFFRKGALSWPSEIHGRPCLKGLKSLKLDPKKGEYVLHDSWRTSGEILDKISRYTDVEARQLHESGIRFTVRGLVGAVMRDAGRGIAYQTAKSGLPGLMAFGFTVFYRFVVWVRLWELEGRSRTEDRKVMTANRLVGFFAGVVYSIYRRLHPLPRNLGE